MPRFFRKIKKKVGNPPGTLIYTGEKRDEKIKVKMIEYNDSDYNEKEIEENLIDKCLTFKDTKEISWLNIEGIHKLEIIEKIGNYVKIHPLVLEDIVNVNQRPKIENFDDYIYLILKILDYDENKNEVILEQISIIFSSNYVITFREKSSELFNPIINRIRTKKGQIRKMGTDYLVYSLIDIVIDYYFLILENIGEKIEDMEAELVTNPTESTLQNIHQMKRGLLTLRRSIWPLREVINRLLRRELPFIHEESNLYFRDLYDHTIQIIDTIETLRDILSGMLDIYLSSVSNKMNEVMKVLTVIATIFIPLTFLTGIFGINFIALPNIYWEGIIITLVAMLIVTIFMVIYFKRKNWL